MSQAALPSNPAASRFPVRLPGGRLGIGLSAILIPTAIVALAAGPESRAHWMQALAHLHPHAPYLRVLGRVWRVHPIVILHMSAAFTALGIGTALMIGVKGTTAHRTLGYAWCAAMMFTAISSFWIRGDHGRLSFIHFLSGWTTLAVPLGIAFIRRRQVRRHARMMTSVFVGGLMIAGALTFLPGRLMFSLFFG